MKRAAPFLVAAVAAAYFAAFVHYGILLEDEGLILLQIARTFRGERPYLDFHTGYPPGGFYLNAALFRLFGESVVPLRWLLVAVNAASTGLLYALVQPLAGRALAVAVALGWAFHLPVFVGLFAAFNVPYPSWYGVCAFLAVQVAFDRHLTTGRRLPLFAAGLAAGVAFAIKQNAGALAVLSCGITLALCHAGDGDRDRHLARVLLVLAAAFLVMGFTVALTTVEAAFILGPTIVLIAGRVAWARASVAAPSRLGPAILLLGSGTVAVTLVWLVPFLWTLGVAGLLREIFLVGTDFDLVYATPYPIPFGFPDAWSVVATLALASLAASTLAIERGTIRGRTAMPLLALAGAGLLVLVARWSRMPEGLARSITLQVQHVSFFAAPLLSGVVAVVWLRRVRRAGRDVGSLTPRLLGVLVFALCMYAELYPRVDETHLIIALPSTLLLAAWVTARLARAWARMLDVPVRRVTGAVAAAGIGLALLAAVPNFRALVTLRDGGLHPRGLVYVDSPAAPVGLDEAHRSDIDALNALLGHLRARLAPGEGLFGFPGVALVPYLLGHPSVTRHDYWYAGRPDHLEEAEVVRGLAAAPPRFVVTVNRNIGFFSNSARYYFILRAFVHEHYVLTARFGRYDVLTRRDVAALPPHVELHVLDVGDDLRAALGEPIHEPRYAAVRAFLDRAGSAEGIPALARSIAPDEPSLLLLLRAFPEWPDLRTVPFLARTFDQGEWRVRSHAGNALNFMALHAAEHRYLLGRLPGEREPSPADLLGSIDGATVRRWLMNRRDRYQVGAFSAWLLATLGDRDAIPAFQSALQPSSRDPYLRLMSAYGLVRAGRSEYLCDLVDFLGETKHEFQDAIPSLLLDLAESRPTELALCLERGLLDGRARGREMSAWVAGAAALGGAAPALRDALHDPAWRVRAAAAWALGRLRDAAARADLARLAEDDDARTRAFAVDALLRLDGGG